MKNPVTAALLLGALFETPTATIGIRGTRLAVKVGEPSFR
jgi:hypothetical protein